MPDTPWIEFAAAVGAITDRDPSELTPEMLVIGDLGLDSFGLSELIVSLIVDFGFDELSDGLDARNWDLATLGELAAEFAARSLESARTEFVIDFQE